MKYLSGNLTIKRNKMNFWDYLCNVATLKRKRNISGKMIDYRNPIILHPLEAERLGVADGDDLAGFKVYISHPMAE